MDIIGHDRLFFRETNVTLFYFKLHATLIFKIKIFLPLAEMIDLFACGDDLQSPLAPGPQTIRLVLVQQHLFSNICPTMPQIIIKYCDLIILY